MDPGTTRTPNPNPVAKEVLKQTLHLSKEIILMWDRKSLILSVAALGDKFYRCVDLDDQLLLGDRVDRHSPQLYLKLN
ncbi:hypothetical protein FRX31_033702 [Thalictrum thalictroides]|uniref:Uncharacterized protein n=1 Tax=Thalictrum thalictroides TaxID=46969 RepID=A0A7J6UX10_THATH|nr:hypothetical protein FRX31_033702 [Thalictrum thalictroides]